MHTYMYTYTHTYIYTYIQTYKHTNKHIYIQVFSFELSDADMARIDELKKDPIIAIPEFINK